MTQIDAPAMSQMADPTLQCRPSGEVDDKIRGRGQSRVSLKPTEDEGELSQGEFGDGHTSGDDGPSRKRRRSRKGLDKKFECPSENCGKSYSRAEHLHRDRHTAKGSQLHRKDSMLSQGSPVSQIPKPQSLHGSTSPEVMRPSLIGPKTRTTQIQYQSPLDIRPTSFSPVTNPASGTYAGAITTNGADGYQSVNYKRPDAEIISGGQIASSAGSSSRDQRHQSFGTPDAKSAEFSRPLQTTTSHYGMLPTASINQNYRGNQPHSPQAYISHQNFPPFSLPPPGFANVAANAIPTREPKPEPPFHTPVSTEYSHDTSQAQQSGPDMMLLDQMAVSYTIPVFGGEGCYNRSPFAMPEDIWAYLFSNQQNDIGQMNQQPYANSYPDATGQYYGPHFTNENGLEGFYPPTAHQSHHPMAVTSLLDTSLPETVLSEEKSQAIIDLIKERFNGTGNTSVIKQKGSLLEGDRSDEKHMMSRKMMQAYIASYWQHFSDQMPILHKPTFSPDKTQNLLLIAMMAIGASCLGNQHTFEVTQAGAELSNFLAWHLRWEIFSDHQFRPPAKLWVFQALLLLELFEKMYSTRALHERAHIHHATTITLMRRGSSLTGRYALDSPPSVRDDKQGYSDSRQSPISGAHTPNEWWNHWITNEATRRAAFAAFVIDSTHATMFGHSTDMVAHEMRIPLPCDEAMWTATSSAEFGRLESNLQVNGMKSISFLEGLRRTLHAQEVRTNSFGRTILMAGLLSVSWHMNQRDLQVSSLGVSPALGNRDKWRSSLNKAFDHWDQDFDASLLRQSETMTGPYGYTGKENNVVYQSRIVLHHLAHMAMHVDVVDCQILARAKRLLGRAIGSQDLSSVQRKMSDIWAPTAKARDATYNAIKFLCTVLLPKESASVSHGYDHVHPDPPFDYSARDDMLLNRPWVLYFAALIVWCYGFALEGSITGPVPALHSFDDQVLDMRVYLRRFGSVDDPAKLIFLTGFNKCTGLLMVLRTLFKNTRWELLHEAALLLTNCIDLVGGQPHPPSRGL
ncbi:hypothetical protein SBOR_4142 [Sclerotinia borealis F-4128]|uniref:Xylanolytic transcriptional activator regulatory domain-containing protein n=1 Tax=Sclerotinia borealis (strain F-4128) TaxID=1432307 RepID=W9CHQ0_SCLBF|nr:hypothetical protein SBOR_4142 [Sclerotinia borealis F-4128]